MSRPKRRKPVHYVTFAYADGATVACLPARKPTKLKIADEGIHIDSDYVMREYRYSSSGTFEGASNEQRVRMADLLSNRLNMRRTIRELVLPCLANLQAMLRTLDERLQRIEEAVSTLRPPQRPSRH
jgi:hypothetical protein